MWKNTSFLNGYTWVQKYNLRSVSKVYGSCLKYRGGSSTHTFHQLRVGFSFVCIYVSTTKLTTAIVSTFYWEGNSFLVLRWKYGTVDYMGYILCAGVIYYTYGFYTTQCVQTNFFFGTEQSVLPSKDFTTLGPVEVELKTPISGNYSNFKNFYIVAVRWIKSTIEALMPLRRLWKVADANQK